jgi:AraC-like DNA-binding protein
MDADAHIMIDELAPVVDIASYWEFDHDQWHRYGIPGHHLVLVRRGRIDAVTDAGRMHAGPGEMLCFRPCALNQYGHRGVLHYHQLHLTFAPPPRHRLTPYFDGIGPLPWKVVLGERQHAAVACMEEAMQLIESRSPEHRLRLRASVFALLAVIAQAAPGRRRFATTLDPWQEARRRLESGLDQELPLALVARELGLSVDHFSRRFRARFGSSPGRVRTHARLRLAAHLLRAGSDPIKSVARKVGIHDATAFTRLFRRHFGMPPSALASTDPVAPAPLREPGLITNRHLVAPEMPADWERKFQPRR